MMAGTVVGGIILALALFRVRKILGAAALSAAGGLAALGAVNLTGRLTGVALPLNLFSLLVCCLLGAPGVITMLLLRLFWI